MERTLRFRDAKGSSVEVSIVLKQGKLSIMGNLYDAEVARNNPDEPMVSGQILKMIKPKNKFQKGLLAFWDRWHLNNSRIQCEHQEAEDWGKKQLTVVRYGMKHEYTKKRSALKMRNVDRVQEPGETGYTKEELALVNAPLTIYEPEYEKCNKRWYEKKDQIVFLSGGVYPAEHHQGELNKPCPVCGHRYGKYLEDELPPKIFKAIEYFYEKVNESDGERA